MIEPDMANRACMPPTLSVSRRHRQRLWCSRARSIRERGGDHSDNRTICRPLLSVLSSLTYFSGRIHRGGVFNPMKAAMSPMKALQLVVSAFHTGEESFKRLM